MSRQLLECAAWILGYEPEPDDTDSDLLLVIDLRLNGGAA